MTLFAQIMKWAAVVLQVVTTVESVLPSATGTQKKAVTVGILSPPTMEVSSLGNIIDNTVAALNAAGVFQKKPVTPVEVKK